MMTHKRPLYRPNQDYFNLDGMSQREKSAYATWITNEEANLRRMAYRGKLNKTEERLKFKHHAINDRLTRAICARATPERPVDGN